ncbi:uncharacterized protein LOC106630846 isoform X2 [Falco cherrug]|uniref:uncharacterized protein LOC106630846 isoform X2 n=1 Tax=Falco cherrug TaxID=345164 RepID=UPI0024783CFD|nr:uncharacterized protein LOC106630846 isoform X2 [Falco cherrug]
MDPRGAGLGWLCIAVLCSGAALVLKEKEPGHQNTTQHDDTLEPTGDPTTTARDVAKLTTWPTATPTPPWTWDPHHPAGADASRRRGEQNPYWSPGIFVVVALLVLLVTYWRTKGEGSRDRAASASDSSDLGALDHVPNHDTTPIIPIAQEERKGLEKPPDLEHNETTFCEPDPPPPQLLPSQLTRRSPTAAS